MFPAVTMRMALVTGAAVTGVSCGRGASAMLVMAFLKGDQAVMADTGLGVWPGHGSSVLPRCSLCPCGCTCNYYFLNNYNNNIIIVLFQ